ncbi:MAG: hypothetical protein LBH31_01985 [Burkholderiaceae bacterium]|jgi:hypothetical protein|nr:hypothetical protein [Burkholderiaceae bacterium]
MTYTRESVIESYGRIGNIRGVCEETGCPPYNAYIWLRKTGILTVNDRCSYGTSASKLGGDAEAEFQHLVPKSINANKYIDKNMPSFDFMVGKATIDVKYCGYRNDGKWIFKTAANKYLAPDFYCAFLIIEKDKGIKGPYHTLLIPHDLTTGVGQVYIDSCAPEISRWWPFIIPAKELASVLDDAADSMSHRQNESELTVKVENELAEIKKIGRAVKRESNKRIMEQRS